MSIVATSRVERGSFPHWPCVAAVVIGLAGAAHAHATVYKCDGPAGVPVYQDNPCPEGKQLRDFDKDPPTVSVMPLTPGLLPGTTSKQVLTPAPAESRPSKSARSKAAALPAGKASERKFIAPGINEGEVITRLGVPDMKSGGGSRKLARWTYLPSPDDPGTVTTLTFEHGRLVEVERKVVK
jgi:hypothetical protein